MQQVLSQMLSKYQINNIEDKKNAIKEIVQEIVLCGLSRGGFFKEAAFYGGTALRIFYGLDRFSEDLDFSLITQNPDFDLTKYFPYIENETKSLGLNFNVTEKIKSVDSNIKSAFLKGNTKEHILSFYEDSNIKFSLYKNDELLQSVEVSFKEGEPADVALLLESSVNINKDDNFHIKVERNEGDETRFVFDSLLSFFDEE